MDKHNYVLPATGSFGTAGKGINGEDVRESPVQELLSRLSVLLEDTHSAMSLLDARLEPVRAPSPVSDGESSKPYATMPSQIENRLMNIQSGLEALHRRLVAARDELRI